ncbi:uncharacterized protein LOC17881968 [Capsella rubella]|uniref:uncharacterized protein LOC17881968 n=1 Tax=Capsella rubella TaxID=81985 RepID=UPI000CD58237|nr:uncharacterized protein LOC17881968 [Capsella rubella]
MASQTIPEVVIGYPVPPSSATLSSICGWWSRPIATYPAPNDRKATWKEATALVTPFFGILFTFIAVLVYIHCFIENAHCHTKFSIQSIAFSPSSATWHVTFLVHNPNPRYSIYYGGDETGVRLGSSNAAVLSTYHERKSPSHTAFSVDFVAEDNPNDAVVSKELNIKLSAAYKVHIIHFFNHAGYVDIKCRNLALSYDNVEEIQCHSSFTKQKILVANSVSVSNANANANVSGADWMISFVAKSPVTDCKISLHSLKSRLLRGNQVISSSSPADIFGKYVAADKTNVVFGKVIMSEVIGDVIWNFRVEFVSGVKTDAIYGNGFLMATCPDIPVKFTTDSTGKVMGSLLGNMRRCEYKFRRHLDYSSYISG